MAMLDCVCGSILPVRAAKQLAQAQFHCGKPPPAPLPRIWMRINRSFRPNFPFDLDRAGVASALEKDRHRFERRFDPALFSSPHK